MNEMLTQPLGSVAKQTNKQAIARHFGVKQSEVVYFSVGAVLSGYKVIYDKETQRAYSLPDLGSWVTAISLSPAGVLTHSAGSVDLGALAVTREEYVTLPGSFDTGVTINAKNELVTFTDGKYRWDGALPKVVPAGTDPTLPGSGYIRCSNQFTSTQTREALRRSYASTGYNLVNGSFESGGTLVNANDVLLQERTGKAFSGPAGAVAAGTNPASGGFVAVDTSTLKSQVLGTFSEVALLNLPVGARIETSGYYSHGDGGAAKYIVVSASDFVGIPDGYGDVVLPNGNILSLTNKTFIAASQYGINNGDDDRIAALINRLSVNGGTLFLDKIVSGLTKTIRSKINVSIRGISKDVSGFIFDYSSFVAHDLYSVPINTGLFIEGGSVTDRGAKYGRVFSDFFVQGVNNSTVLSTGVYVGIHDRRLIPDSASSINYSLRSGEFRNIDISQFDVGLNLSECWASKFDFVSALACRNPLLINGQSVNCTFSQCQLNAALSAGYTSSTADSVVVTIDNYTNYGPTESKVGRPEGITFSQCGIYQAKVGVWVKGVLHCTFDQCIIDLHTTSAFKGVSTSGVELVDCYLASNDGATVELGETGTASDLNITIRDCQFMGKRLGNQAFLSRNRIGINLINNTFTNYTSSTICLFDSVGATTIKDNIFQRNTDDRTQVCISAILKAGHVEIDGNMSKQGNDILRLGGSPTNLVVGSNRSQWQCTREFGLATILAGQSSVTVDLKHNDTSTGARGDTGIKSLVFATPKTIVTGLSVATDGLNSCRATFTVPSPVADNTVIMWESICYR